MHPTGKPQAMITGASEGIGRSFAVKLAQRGYVVTAIARNEERLDSLLAEIGREHRKVVTDLSTEGGLALVLEYLKTDHFTLLINNAGSGFVGQFSDTPLANIRAMIFLNITSVVDLSHAFLARAKRGDGIIQVASVLSYLPMPKQAIYSATKAFVASFAESLWIQCRQKGITVINLCPGSTATNFAERAGWEKNSVPAWASESAETVAENALRALERKSGPTVVSGWMNQLTLVFTRFLTRRALVRLMGAVRK